MKIPSTLGIRTVSIFKLSEERMDKAQVKRKKSTKASLKSKSEDCLQLILKSPEIQLGVYVCFHIKVQMYLELLYFSWPEGVPLYLPLSYCLAETSHALA